MPKKTFGFVRYEWILQRVRGQLITRGRFTELLVLTKNPLTNKLTDPVD